MAPPVSANDPGQGTMNAALLRWTLVDARRLGTTEELLSSFGSMLVDAGVPVSRINAPMWVRHPLVRVAGWTWTNGETGPRVTSFKVSEIDASFTRMYVGSPFPLVVEDGVDFIRRRIGDADCPMDFTVLADLRAAGVTDYVILGGTLSRCDRTALTFATRAPDGFTDTHLGILIEALPAFLLHLDLRLASELTETVCRTYLGPRTGPRVVAGHIRRGEVERVDAVIGFCDLRGFTAASDVRSPEDVTELLNLWFDAIAKQVDATGGEILKFIGDAALVMWPIDNDPRAACMHAVQAAMALEASLPETLRGGLALHRGEVAYGNIGAADRLDFTVIGAAVNLASRLEGLCARLKAPWIVSSAVAEHVDVPLTDLGLHLLKGLSDPVRVWGPPT